MIRPTTLKIDLGDRQAGAGRFNNNHPDLALSAVAQTYQEAPFFRDDFEKRNDRKLAELIYDPVDIAEEKSPASVNKPSRRNRLDDLREPKAERETPKEAM
jgi:hypothetical protein